MKQSKPRNILEFMNQIPPAEWDEVLAAMSPRDRNDMSDELSSFMIHAGRLKGYIEGRYMYSERPHDFAVKASNKLAERIRKVLGYVYPKDDIRF
jgi:hypothetical protein